MWGVLFITVFDFRPLNHKSTAEIYKLNITHKRYIC